MWEIVGGVVRHRDPVAKVKIAKFFPGVFAGDSRKFPAIRYTQVLQCSPASVVLAQARPNNTFVNNN